MTKSQKARKKFEKISQDKSNAYLTRNKPEGNKKNKVNNDNNKESISDKYRKGLVSNATKAELIFKDFLDRNMVNYQFQKVLYISVDCKQKFYIADFYFKRYNLIVELDGGYHYTNKQKIKDDIRSMHLRRAGYFILRFDNSRVSNCKNIYSEIIKFIETKFGDL